jgi:hypothetical protein
VTSLIWSFHQLQQSRLRYVLHSHLYYLSFGGGLFLFCLFTFIQNFFCYCLLNLIVCVCAKISFKHIPNAVHWLIVT